ncbi:MAG: response regulator [candidate division Zixibacteria bacterium]|nr:response regulator [candidate division Zixibacteria bacterium]
MTNGDTGAPIRPEILLVDDDQEILCSLSSFLEETGYQTASALSGREAMTSLENNNIRIVISDMMMPGITGTELATAVKEKDASIKVILITGYTGFHSPVEAIAAGADAYLTKPFELAALAAMVDKLLPVQARS